MSDKARKYEERITRLQRSMRVNKLKLKLAQAEDRYKCILADQSDKVIKIQAELVKAQEDLTEARKTIFRLRKNVNTARSQLIETLADRDNLLVEMDKSQSVIDDIVTQRNSSTREKFCPVCLVPHAELDAKEIHLMALTTCGHVLCSPCMLLQNEIQSVCPMCQTSFTNEHLIKLYI
ncbi:hypothetical protein HDE_06543 [Halotydeus destructor]|nr:hypothetical protein HDE_06543 [Halotydeus destructor]